NHSTAMSTPVSSTVDTEPKIKASNAYQVCEDLASIINYGALTCLSCPEMPDKIAACQFDGHCAMTALTRKLCTACRLNKCLAVGMSPELIRKEDLSNGKRKPSKSRSQERLQCQTLVTTPQQSALNRPSRGSGSILNSSELIVISNVVHAFDTFSPITQVRRTINLITTSTSNLSFDLPQSLQMIQSFISSTPDFKVLTTSEQWSLFRRNMLGLLSIGGMYFMRESGIFDKPEHEMAILPLYGNDIVQQVKAMSGQFQCDPTIVKLILVVLAFSSNCFTKENRRNLHKDSLLLGTFRLFGSQNVYVELTWKYLIHRYGYEESVKNFSSLIKHLLDALKLSIEIYENNEVFQTFIDDKAEYMEQSPNNSDSVIVPLWGKS
ncbi:unnamed protein product, partial [Rotaria magnacalcarata]